VLVVVYLFNINALPLLRGEPLGFFYVTLVSFLNLGLAGFVLASIAARFIFPAVSLEGRQMWLLRSSPLDLRALLWSKYWVGTVPLLVLALLLTGLTNVLLEVGPFMMVMGLVTICGLTFAIAALALGFGALYPQFETENAAQIPTSFGGLVYMMTTIALLAAVIVAMWQAVYAYVRAVYVGEPALPPAEYVGPAVGVPGRVQDGEPAAHIEETVGRGGMVLHVHVQSVRRAGRAQVEVRRRRERPATPHGEVQLAAEKGVLGVEVISDPRADPGAVDAHRAPAPHAPLRVGRGRRERESGDDDRQAYCEPAHTGAPRLRDAH